MVTNLARVLLSLAFLFSLCAPSHADQYDDRAAAEAVARRLQQIDEANMDAARRRLHAAPPRTDAEIDEYNNTLNRIFLPMIGVLLVLLVVVLVQRQKAKRAEADREQMEARRKYGKDW